MGYLHSCPAYLEDDHKRRVIQELGPHITMRTVYTTHEQEGKGYSHKDRA